MLGLKLNHVSKRGHRLSLMIKLSSRSVLVGRSKDYVRSVGEITIGFLLRGVLVGRGIDLRVLLLRSELFGIRND